VNDSASKAGGRGIDSRLVESEERYRAVIENASDMIQSCRPDGSFEFVNRAWVEKLGYTEEDLKDLVVWDIIDPESLGHCQELFMRAIQGETVQDVLATFITKDGRKLPVEGDATSRFVDGKVIATHSFFRDITERLRAQELEERNQKLERERMARYLEKMAALGKLAAGLAHELNNPAAAAQRAGAQLSESAQRLETALNRLHRQGLTAEQWNTATAFVGATPRPPSGERRPTEVSRLESEMEDWLADHAIAEGWELAAGLVQEGVEPQQLDALAAALPPSALEPVLAWFVESNATKELTDVVTRSTERISDLVAAVKAYSFMDRAAEQTVDVHDGIENTLVILGHRMRGLTVRREYDRGLPLVRAFGSGLNQVWTNILDNAADAVGKNGTITIRTRGEDGRVIVEIEDDGPGIPEEHLTRVFEPFFSTKPQGEGTGLGLDTVWRIVTEEHDGTVEVESNPGQTVFLVSLPVADD
jgi:PAS domain S-box-containing protein